MEAGEAELFRSARRQAQKASLAGGMKNCFSPTLLSSAHRPNGHNNVFYWIGSGKGMWFEVTETLTEKTANGYHQHPAHHWLTVPGKGGGCDDRRGRNAKIQRRPDQRGSSENGISIRPPKLIPVAEAALSPMGRSHKMPTIPVSGSGSNEQIVRMRAPRMRRRAKPTLPTATPMAISAATDERAAYHSRNRGGRSPRGGELNTLEAAQAIYQMQNKEHANPKRLTILHRHFVVVFIDCVFLS